MFIIWSGKATPLNTHFHCAMLAEVGLRGGEIGQRFFFFYRRCIWQDQTLEPTADVQLQIWSRKVSEYLPRWTFYLLVLPMPMLIWMLSNNKKLIKIRLRVLWIVSFSQVFMKWESFTLFPYFTWHSGPYILLNEHKITLYREKNTDGWYGELHKLRIALTGFIELQTRKLSFPSCAEASNHFKWHESRSDKYRNSVFGRILSISFCFI